MSKKRKPEAIHISNQEAKNPSRYRFWNDNPEARKQAFEEKKRREKTALRNK